MFLKFYYFLRANASSSFKIFWTLFPIFQQIYANSTTTLNWLAIPTFISQLNPWQVPLGGYFVGDFIFKFGNRHGVTRLKSWQS